VQWFAERGRRSGIPCNGGEQKHMRFGRFFRAALIVTAAFVLVGSASASTIFFTTVGGLGHSTGFNGIGGDVTLNSTSGTNGASAVLTYVPFTTITGVATPSNTNFGEFDLNCNSCTNQGGGAGATFGAFTFQLFVYDTTDGAVGEWIGTAAGGTVYNDQSAIGMTINWQTPLTLGPGGNAAVSGNFGTTFFTINSTTQIVSPNTNGGVETVQGTVNSNGAIPEPATMAMVGGLFIGLAVLARKRRA
jgi:PEP-CTERM motif